ncbi:MAG: hypothetical protein ACI9P5_002986 [Saprospiraceae bacterium]|jgi:hypothetical protein
MKMSLKNIYIINLRAMNYLKMISLKSTLSMIVLFATLFVACKDEDDEGFAITNDLRVLQVKINDETKATGATEISVISEMQFVFSHKLDQNAFDNGLSITPSVNFSTAFDETGSFVTIKPDVRFDYETPYSINLPKGIYGSSGEQSTADYSYVFTTKSFNAPSISLSADMNSFFEGETITVTARIDNIIFEDVSFDLVYGGSAVGGGTDYTASTSSITIPAGSTEATFSVTSIAGDAIEGEENIIITLTNVKNGVNDPVQELTLLIGDKAPSMELKGVMELDNYIDGTGGRVRAVHIQVLKDIADLSIFHIQIASNGAAPDPTDIDFAFPANSATAGDQLFIVRDADAALAATYFGASYASFTEFQTTGMSQNGDDAVLLYENGVSIESFGEPGVDGTGMEWEYTNSWAYKLGENWYYPGVGCVENAVGEATDETSLCRYPTFSPGLEFRGIMDMNHSGNNLRAYHIFALQDIADISTFGAGIASNGQATSDGVEIPFPSQSVKAGEHILLIRDLDVSNAEIYFGDCYAKFEHIIPIGGLSSNGDDTIELFKDNGLIETYGELGVDGTGMFWEYDNSWAYKVAGAWTYGGAGCTTDATTNATSSCPYTFCN